MRMTQEQFTDAVVEQFFIQGLNCPNFALLPMYANVVCAARHVARSECLCVEVHQPGRD